MFGINYRDLDDIEKLLIVFEMLRDKIIKNEILRMIGYSSDIRKKNLKELYEFFSNIILTSKNLNLLFI